jgi:SAM-dependent methyltransferase
MREQLADKVPEVAAVDGTAEAIPFDDGSFDLVTVAQAFHWFRFDEALAEVRRVLVPGGGLAILFNQRDDREPWVAEWNAVIDWHSRTISRYQTTDWTAVLTGGGFIDPGHDEFGWDEEMTRDRIGARVRSVSYIAEEPPEVQQQFVDKVVALVDGFPEVFPVPYRTHVWWARRP